MSENYKILGKYIKDMSSETPDIETYLFVREYISKYQLNIDIVSKALKNKIIEINTTLKFEDKKENKKKSYFEIVNSTIIQINEKITDKKEFVNKAMKDYDRFDEIRLELLSLNKEFKRFSDEAKDSFSKRINN